MKFDLVLWANSGDSDPGQNPTQKKERETPVVTGAINLR